MHQFIAMLAAAAFAVPALAQDSSSGLSTADPLGAAYQGCFTDNAGRDLLAVNLTDSGNMTIQECHGFCGSQGYSFFGLEYYVQCFCGDSINDGVLEDQCTDPCAGDSTQACGGNWHMGIYSISLSPASATDAPATSSATDAAATSAAPTSSPAADSSAAATTSTDGGPSSPAAASSAPAAASSAAAMAASSPAASSAAAASSAPAAAAPSSAAPSAAAISSSVAAAAAAPSSVRGPVAVSSILASISSAKASSSASASAAASAAAGSSNNGKSKAPKHPALPVQTGPPTDPKTCARFTAARAIINAEIQMLRAANKKVDDAKVAAWRSLNDNVAIQNANLAHYQALQNSKKSIPKYFQAYYDTMVALNLAGGVRCGQ